jgi:hypothetical protein
VKTGCKVDPVCSPAPVTPGSQFLGRSEISSLPYATGTQLAQLMRTNQRFGVIQPGGLDPHESLTWPGGVSLYANLQHLRTTGAKSASNSPIVIRAESVNAGDRPTSVLGKGLLGLSDRATIS